MNNQSVALIEIMPDIERAAKHIAHQWDGVLDADDLVQEVSLNLLTDRYASELWYMELPLRRRMLHRIASRVAAKEALDYEHFSGNYTYSPGEVRSLLDRGALDALALEELPDTEEVYETQTEDESGELGYERVAASAVRVSVDAIDLRTAFDRLTDRQQEALFRRYVLGERVDKSSAAERLLYRAVDALTNEMNRSRRRRNEEYGNR